MKRSIRSKMIPIVFVILFAVLMFAIMDSYVGVTAELLSKGIWDERHATQLKIHHGLVLAFFVTSGTAVMVYERLLSKKNKEDGKGE